MKYILLIALILGISSLNANEKTVWDYLISIRFTKAGAAGLMGNLEAMSGIKSVFIDSSLKHNFKLTAQEYVAKVDSGQYSENMFINDGIGFGNGLIQEENKLYIINAKEKLEI